MPTLHTVKTFAAKHPAFTESALRFMIFRHFKQLQDSGAIFKMGRKVIVVEEEFIKLLPQLSAPR